MNKEVISGIEKHIEQLKKKNISLIEKISNLQDEQDKVEDEIDKLTKQLKEAERSTIEYHVGDLLLKYKPNFGYHDDICCIYELLEEIKPSDTNAMCRAMVITLYAYDDDIITRTETCGCIDVVKYEDDKDIYYLKSSAIPDILKLFHDLSIEGVPDVKHVDDYLFGKIKEVIDRHNGKKLVDVIAERTDKSE